MLDEETTLPSSSEQEEPGKASPVLPEFKPDMALQVIERLEAEIAALQKELLRLKGERSSL